MQKINKLYAIAYTIERVLGIKPADLLSPTAVKYRRDIVMAQTIMVQLAYDRRFSWLEIAHLSALRQHAKVRYHLDKHLQRRETDATYLWSYEACRDKLQDQEIHEAITVKKLKAFIQ